jgi:predicted molibdopterin-dependent oxidoreductase YjgC
MRIHQAIEPIGNTLADWEIICRLSTAMGYEMIYQNPEEIFNEMASLTPKSYAGMTYARLGLDGLQWPCPDSDHPGTPYLHKGQFTRGKGKFHAVDYQDPAQISPAVESGTLFLPIHFGENPPNVLTSAEAVDPLAKILEFKVSAVNIEKLSSAHPRSITQKEKINEQSKSPGL